MRQVKNNISYLYSQFQNDIHQSCLTFLTDWLYYKCLTFEFI